MSVFASELSIRDLQIVSECLYAVGDESCFLSGNLKRCSEFLKHDCLRFAKNGPMSKCMK